MKFIKNIFKLSFLICGAISFLGCTSAKNLQNSMPFKLGDAYYQQWISGVKGGGSGVNLFIPMLSNPNNIVLDCVYFRGQKSKLEVTDNNLFTAHFQSDANQKKDVIMSSEPYAEYGNKVPELPKKSPFQLKENECVISYKQNSKTKYFKIKNIIKRVPLMYSSTQPKNH